MCLSGSIDLRRGNTTGDPIVKPPERNLERVSRGLANRVHGSVLGQRLQKVMYFS
jgi:hypothetical protein